MNPLMKRKLFPRFFSLSLLTIGQWTVLFLAVGVLCRIVRYTILMPVWGDEALLAVNFLERDWTHIFEPLENNQVLPAGYLLVNWFLMQLFGYSEWVLRFPATICSILGLVWIYRFGKSNLETVQTMLVVGIMAVSYYSVRYGAEFKPYAADLLLSILLLKASCDLRYREITLSSSTKFVGLTCLAPFFSYPSVFVIGSCLFVLILDAVCRQHWQLLRLGIFSSICFSVVFSAYYLSYITIQAEQGSALFDTWKDTFPPESLLSVPIWVLEKLSGKMMAYPAGGGSFASILTLVMFALGIACLYRAKRRFLLLLLISPLLFNYIAAALHLYPFGGSARFAQYATPSIVILAGIGLTYLLRRKEAGPIQYEANNIPPRRVRYALIFILTLGFVLVTHSVVKPYKSRGVFDVRNTIEILLEEYRCSPVKILNKRLQTPVNYAWYLGFDQRGQFDAKSDLIADRGRTPLCIMIFDQQRYPKLLTHFQDWISQLKDRKVLFEESGNVYIYGGKKHPHHYHLIVVE